MTKEEIKNIRKDLGLTQQMMAERLGVDIKTVRNYEKLGNIPKSKEAIFLSLKDMSFSKNSPASIIIRDSNTENKGNSSDLSEIITELKLIIKDKNKTIETLSEELKEKTFQINHLLTIIENMVNGK